MPVADPLSKTHPELAAQWHPTRNEGLTPNDVRANSYKKVWWRCAKGHDWDARVGNRALKGYGCSYCCHLKATEADSIATLFPDLAAEWHPSKNGALLPIQVTPGSSRLVWWRCARNPEHEWETRVDHRAKRGTGCPVCSGRRITPATSFAGRFPALASQWHPTRNGARRPEEFASNSQFRAWWLCPANPNHEWETHIRSRTSHPTVGCPVCARQRPSPDKNLTLADANPELCAEWHPEKNGVLTPDQVKRGSSQRVWWRCSKDQRHEWESTIHNRSVRGNGCPFCSGQAVDPLRSLEALNPVLAKQWHPTKNGDLTPDKVTPGSDRMAWWVCPVNANHQWQARVQTRAKARRSTGCPLCATTRSAADNSLARMRPDIASEWHPEKNGALTPSTVSVASARKVWWRCAKDSAHEWRAQIKNRTLNSSGCPQCRVGWTVHAIRAFVDGLKHHLQTFTPAELYVLFQQNGLLGGQRNSQAFLDALATGRFPFGEIEKFCRGEKSLVDRFLADQGTTLEKIAEESSRELQQGELGLAGETPTDEATLPAVETVDVLRSLQAAVVVSADQEAVEFLVASALAKIWKHAFRDEAAALAQARSFAGDAYADRVRTDFLAEHERAAALPIPAGYAFTVDGKLAEPNLMQRLTAARVLHRRRVGNWSGTGAGKTLSAVLASRVAGAGLTVVCCPNSVVEGWRAAILASFPDSVVGTKTFAPDWTALSGDATGFGTAQRHRYLVLNYEMFQQEDSEAKVRCFADGEAADFIVVDEIHFTKQRTAENLSRRKRLVSALITLAGSKQPQLCVLGMSATPVINNLQEGKSLVEMVSGLEHPDIETRPNVANCMKLHQRLVSLGTRWVPKYDAELEQCEVAIDCVEVIEEIRALGRAGSPLALEQILTRVRLPIIRREVRRKTLLYTHYLQGIEGPLRDALSADGWRVGFFTGDDKSGLDGFLRGDVDVLIGSSAIGTGVDGLQDVCERLIVNVLPWTNAEFEQLKGRIYRQGQRAAKVTVVLPLTFAMVNAERWSWCESKMRRLKFKKSIADAAVDGVVPEGHLRSPAQAYQDVMGWLGRLTTGEVEVVSRTPISVTLSPGAAESERRQRSYGDLSAMNRHWNQTNSAKTAERLRQNPDEWAHYHTLYREARKTWAVVPFAEVIRWAEKRSGYVIADFGCGEAKLAAALSDRHTVHSFDYVAANEDVVACDVAHVPMEDEALDVAVFSLSLMGANFTEYLREAWRLLKLDGHLHIYEATSRFTDRAAFAEGLKELGFSVVTVEDAWKFTHVHALKFERTPDTSFQLRF